MDAALIARLGLSRLRLPVPTVKVTTVHAIAKMLQDKEHGNIVWDALLKWIAELELESEVLEALCIPVLAKNAPPSAAGALQRVIERPSPLADIYLTEISGQPLLVNSWAKSNSGEVPPLFSADTIIEYLSAGRIVPPILATRLQHLQKRSKYPFLKQWAYEYQRLVDRYGKPKDGYWEYFIEDERERSIGQFIARSGHFARSAYLRTLSLAFDCWQMPEDIVYQESMYATPADFVYLRMPPGMPPSWIDIISNNCPVSQRDWNEVMCSIIQKVAQDDAMPELLHLNMPLCSTKHYQAEVEMITCLYDGNEPAMEDVFNVHRYLLGRAQLPRTDNGDIIDLPQGSRIDFSCGSSGVCPALIPSVANYVGYFHSDLISRLPYLPANYSESITLIARPRIGGMDILHGDQLVGEIRHWNWQWSPTHDKALGPHCGVYLVVSKECRNEVLSLPKTIFSRYWRATILTRENDYGAWEEKILFGKLPNF